MEKNTGDRMTDKTISEILGKELSREVGKAYLHRNFTRNEKRQTSKPKMCMMCGNPTTNASGFCNNYVGTKFGCKEMWKEEYGKMPTKKELNANWRIIE